MMVRTAVGHEYHDLQSENLADLPFETPILKMKDSPMTFNQQDPRPAGGDVHSEGHIINR
jgi:hypothetical protein